MSGNVGLAELVLVFRFRARRGRGGPDHDKTGKPAWAFVKGTIRETAQPAKPEENYAEDSKEAREAMKGRAL